MEPLEELVRNTLRKFLPPPKLTLSQWADKYAYLSSESSAEAGKWHTIPYQKEIMDAITDPTIEHITVMKSARVGFTKILNHTIAYHIHQDPCSIMVVQPTVEDAEGYSKEEIAPMIRDTPVLQGVVSDAKAKDGTNTILLKTYAGGTLSMVGANSPRGFRRVSRRIVLFDEVDGYPASAGTEGDPIKLGIKRTEYFWNRKIISGSTPTTKDFSKIERLYNSTDQRRFYVPCPHCGHEQYLRWPQMKWPEGEPQKAYYECEKNKCIIDHKEKRAMVEKGTFRATAQGNGRHIGFHIWAAYSFSPNATWGNLAEEFLEAKKDPDTLKTFLNATLGEVWDEEHTTKLEASELFERCEFYKEYVAPEPVVVLVAGVDVQDNRLECSVWGFCHDEEAYLITHQVIHGDPSRPDVWKQLDQILFKPIRHESGAELYIQATAVDSGGHFTQEVYAYTRERRNKHVFAVKGQSQKGKPPLGKAVKVDMTFKGVPFKNGALVYPMGSDTIKDTLFRRLKITEAGAGCLHFYMGLGTDYFEQLTSEKQKVRLVKGFPVREWVKKNHARNEALDCLVMSFAALHYLYSRKSRRTMFAQYEGALKKAPKTPTKQEEINPINDEKSSDNSEKTPNKPEQDKNMLELQKIRTRPIIRRKGFINNW